MNFCFFSFQQFAATILRHSPFTFETAGFFAYFNTFLTLFCRPIVNFFPRHFTSGWASPCQQHQGTVSVGLNTAGRHQVTFLHRWEAAKKFPTYLLLLKRAYWYLTCVCCIAFYLTLIQILYVLAMFMCFGIPGIHLKGLCHQFWTGWKWYCWIGLG